MKGRLRRSSKNQFITRVVFAAVLVVIVGMLLPRVFSFAGNVFMTPFHATNVWLSESTSLVPTFIRDRQSLKEENERLSTELFVAQRSDVTFQRLFEENNRLRSMLGAEGEERILSAIVARPTELPYDYLQIDRGANDGIEVGAPVFVGEDVVIGLVSYAAPNYSFVELFTAPGFQTTVFLSGPEVVAQMEGIGSGIARVRVPQGIALQKGNLVYVPSVDPGVFGKISYIENEPTQPEQYGYVTPDLSLHSLYVVAVGRRSQITRSVSEIDEYINDELRGSLVVEGLGLDVSTSTASSAESVADEANPEAE